MKLDISDLAYKYGAGFSLQPLSFILESGQFYALLGPNGSGKSTLLKIIAGLISPDYGTISLDGKNLFDMSFKERARRISYMPQFHFSDIPYKVYEFVSFGRSAFSGFFPSDNDIALSVDMMELLGIKEFADRRVTELSGGEKSKVILAQTLVQQSGVILLDEPLAPLDIPSQASVMHLLANLAKEKNLIVVAAIHDLSFAFTYCDESIFIKEGRMISKIKNNLLDADLLSHIYGISFDIIDYEGESLPLVRRNRVF